MSETKLNWDDLRLFMAVARAGGLANAEHATGKSAPTLGRRMLSLEKHIGKDLFFRDAKGYELTTDGKKMFERMVEVESSISPFEYETTGERIMPVKLSAGTWVTHYLCTRLIDWPEHDSIPLQFIAADHVLDISHRETIIGIRNQRPTQKQLACQQLDFIHFAIYATNKSVSTWVQVLSSTPSAKWVQSNVGNSFSIQVTHPRNALDLALAGTCRMVLPTFIGDSYSELIKVSEDIGPLSHRQWLVTHQDDRHKPEVREVINWLKLYLGGEQHLG